jgi:hypothetical protein
MLEFVCSHRGMAQPVCSAGVRDAFRLVGQSRLVVEQPVEGHTVDKGVAWRIGQEAAEARAFADKTMPPFTPKVTEFR